MELINVSKEIEKTYYLQSEKSFEELLQAINLMPSYAIANVTKEKHQDIYFDTTDKFLANLDSTVRIRYYPEKGEQYLSIVCKNLGIRREFQMTMNYGDTINDKEDYLFFIEDKLQDIYLHRFDFDVVRILKGLKKFLSIETDRTINEVINNQGFKANACFDKVSFTTKRNKMYEYILEVKLDCWHNDENLYFYEKFVKELEKRVILIPMNEKKLDAGLRAFKQTESKKIKVVKDNENQDNDKDKKE